MQDLLRSFFHYSRTERNGFLVLAFLALAFFLAPSVYRTLRSGPSTDFSEFQEEIQQFERLKKAEKDEHTAAPGANPPASLFEFDPNSASAEDLQRLGLPDRVVKTLLNYRSKGGRFKTVEDLQKIYGLSSSDYERLKDYVRLPAPAEPVDQRPAPANNKNKTSFDRNTEVKELFSFDPNTVSKAKLVRLGFPERAANNLLKFREKGGVIREKEDLARIYGITENYFATLYPYIEIKEESVKRSSDKIKNEQSRKATPVVSLDINTANAQDWQALPGIGPKLSERIVKFRDRLGGFISIAQVGETYGLPDSTFQAIQPVLELKQSHQKININTATKESLAAHPYLNNKQANLIINYRRQHGAFKNTEAFNKLLGLPEATKTKIRPYLSFE